MTSVEIGIDKIKRLNSHVSNYSEERLEKVLNNSDITVKDYKKETIGGVTHIRFWIGWSNILIGLETLLFPISGFLSAYDNGTQKWQDYYFDAETGDKLNESEGRQKIFQYYAHNIKLKLNLSLDKIIDEESLSLEETSEDESILMDDLKIDENVIHYRPHCSFDKHKYLANNSHNPNRQTIDKKYDLNDTNKLKFNKVNQIFLKDSTCKKKDFKQKEKKNTSTVESERNSKTNKTNFYEKKHGIFSKDVSDYYTENVTKSMKNKC
jgi:hypothetical protein